MISPESLRRFKLFAGLDASVLKELAIAGEEIRVKGGEWLFKENSPADALYLIESGSIDLTVLLNHDESHIARLPRLVEGEPLGWSAVVKPHIFTMGALAVTDSTLIRLNALRIHELMEENPLVGYLIMRRMAEIIGERLTNLRIQFLSMTLA